MFEESFSTTPDRLKIHYRDYPAQTEIGRSKAPVLCLPGLTRNLRDFEDLAPRLVEATGRRVLAASFRGRGRSDYDPTPENYHPLKYAEDALSVLDAEGLARAVFLGTSNGGLTTMATAAVSPDRIAAAILNDIGPEIGATGLARIKSYAGVGPKAASWEEAVAYAREINKIAFPHYTEEQWAGMARRFFREAEGGAFVLDYDPAIGEQARAQADPAPDLWPLFDALANIPTLVLRGSLSDVLTAETLAAMGARKPELMSREVAGVGHAPMLDEPDAFSALVDFLQGAAE